MFSKTMAVDGLSITEQWIREKLNLQHCCLADVRSLTMPGTLEDKICHLGTSLKNFVRLKSLDLSHNALVTVKGIEHLERLETLNLYYNRLASLEDIFSLHKLQNLKELDLRLNPVVTKHPHYRLYLVYAMTKLQKLDDCPVQDRERKAALMHFSSEYNLDMHKKKQELKEDTKSRSSDLRIKAIQKMIKTLSLLEGKEETPLNEDFRKSWKKKSLRSFLVRCEKECSPIHSHGHPPESETEHLIIGSDLLKQKQEAANHTDLNYKNDEHNDSHRVRFVSPASQNLHSVRAQSAFTPQPKLKPVYSQESEPERKTPEWHYELQDRGNPILHPPRLTFHCTTSSQNPQRKTIKGVYRKPMELLLGMMEDLWSEKKENKHNRVFLMRMVQILRLMEQEVSAGEQELECVRKELKSVREELRATISHAEVQEKQNQSEAEELRTQIQQRNMSIESLNEQLKCVLEENVCLQKQMIRAEQRLLESRLKKIPSTQDRAVQSIPEVRNSWIEEEGGVKEHQENYRSLIARNELLLQQLEEALKRK